MSLMMKILEDLTPLNRVMCSSDYDKTINYLSKRLPFRVLEFSSQNERNGWIIPPKWDIREAKILKDGEVVYDGTQHALGVIALSAPFRGKVEREELRRHLHYDHRYDDSLTFHFRQQFRSWDRDWGFCVPKRLYDALEPGEYEVVLETEESEGLLKILECALEGKLEETIAVCANLDHPGVSNDGLAGVAVGVELFTRLLSRPRKYTYKLILAQGIMGTEYYLASLDRNTRSKIMEAVCLWMLGSRTQLALQQSRSGASILEQALENVLQQRSVDYRKAPFERNMINDEYIWEAYGIDTASLSRFPYPEYHSSRDNVSIMSEDCLQEALFVLEDAFGYMESSPLVRKQFEGTVCLSNPRFDLYVDPGQVAFGEVVGKDQKKLRFLMDFVPSMKRPMTVRAISQEVDLPEAVVVDYLRKWEEKGLLTLQ